MDYIVSKLALSLLLVPMALDEESKFSHRLGWVGLGVNFAAIAIYIMSDGKFKW